MNIGAMGLISSFFQLAFFHKYLGPDGSCVPQNMLDMVFRYYPLYHCPQPWRRIQTDGHSEHKNCLELGLMKHISETQISCK